MSENEKRLIETIKNLVGLFDEIIDFYVPKNHPDFDFCIEERRKVIGIVEEVKSDAKRDNDAITKSLEIF